MKKSRKAILRQLEKYKKYELSLVKKPTHPSYTELKVLEPTPVKEVVPPQFKKRERGAPRLCACGATLSRTQKLCKSCAVYGIPTVEGIKFKPPRYAIHFTKKTGKKCQFVGCEIITENVAGFCFRHEKASKSYKYRTRVPKNVKLNGRPNK